MGDHMQLEQGKKLICFNPKITQTSKETILMKEGCLTFPFIFLSIQRPRDCVVEYEDEKGDKKEAHLKGMFSRIFQHEYDHMLGRNFTERVSKFKLKRAMDKREKMIKKIEKSKQA
jgi:peptide deformylase